MHKPKNEVGCSWTARRSTEQTRLLINQPKSYNVLVVGQVVEQKVAMLGLQAVVVVEMQLQCCGRD